MLSGTCQPCLGCGHSGREKCQWQLALRVRLYCSDIWHITRCHWYNQWWCHTRMCMYTHTVTARYWLKLTLRRHPSVILIFESYFSVILIARFPPSWIWWRSFEFSHLFFNYVCSCVWLRVYVSARVWICPDMFYMFQCTVQNKDKF